MRKVDVKSRIGQRNTRFGARAMYADEEAGDMGWTPDLVDAPVSAGDGFSFEGGEGRERAGVGGMEKEGTGSRLASVGRRAEEGGRNEAGRGEEWRDGEVHGKEARDNPHAAGSG